MRTNRKTVWGLCTLVTLVIGGAVHSQDPGKQDRDKMMGQWMAAAKPGPFHQHLKPLIGSWDCTVKMWMSPGMDPMVQKGRIERRWILERRFIMEEYEGSSEMPFAGLGLVGYNNFTKQYEAVWMDTMSTGMYSETGTCDATGRKFTFTGENFDPISRKMKKTKSTIEIVSPDKHIVRMYDRTPDGKEFVSFEMIATRY